MHVVGCEIANHSPRSAAQPLCVRVYVKTTDPDRLDLKTQHNTINRSDCFAESTKKAHCADYPRGGGRDHFGAVSVSHNLL